MQTKWIKKGGWYDEHSIAGTSAIAKRVMTRKLGIVEMQWLCIAGEPWFIQLKRVKGMIAM